MLALLSLLLAPAGVETPIVVTGRADRVLAAPIVPDPVLATMRGGIDLANGLAVAIGVDIQTRVDGLLLLHTVYASDGPDAGVRVYTDGRDGDRTAPGTIAVNIPGNSGAAAIIVDRSPTGTTVVVGSGSQAAKVNLVNADPGQWLNANGQTPVAVTVGGAPVTQGPGTFRVDTDDSGAVVTLDASMLQIRHLIGQATGVSVANTANNRAIDTVSSVNVDLQGVSPGLMSSLFTADQLALDAMTRR